MTRCASSVTLLAAAIVCLLPAAPALAQRARVFVASYGSDSNPCTFGSPCKTFQNAVNVVAAGGEVTAIDSAGFGTITISHAVTITSPNGVEAGIAAPASGGAAITINAGVNDVVSLNGLTLDGDNVATTTGIQFNFGGSLEVQNCVIRSFSTGISLPAAGTFSVSNTLVSDNGNGGYGGIALVPVNGGSVTGALNHVTMINNNIGLNVSGTNLTANITVADSVIANNGDGIDTDSETPAVNVMVRSSTIANNLGHGLFSQGQGSTIWIARSTITGNDIGWAVNSGKLLSFDDNDIIDNTTTVAAPTTTPKE